MYPEKIDNDLNIKWYGEDYLNKEKYVHVYLHQNYKDKMHSHQFYEINIIVNGKGRHYISDTNVKAITGDVFVIPPEISHGYFTDDRLDIYHILIKKDFFSRYKEEISQIPFYNLLFDFEPMLRSVSGVNMHVNIGLSQFHSIIEDLEYIKNVENNSLYMFENILVLTLVSKLASLFEKNIFEDAKSESVEIIKIMDYIKNNLDVKLSLSDIAKVGNMSIASLNRKFKEYLGLSPMQYVIKCRIAKAKELLDQKNLSKTEIAQICGFYDLVHMNKYFLK